MDDGKPHEEMAEFVRIVGRGPGRSRPLTRDEARDAFELILTGAADPHQIGAFLMLLRYRGETAEELAGFVDAARASLPSRQGLGQQPCLDWPSYSGGRTRGLPWFLFSALALSDAGYPVFMHGANDFSTALGPADILPAFGLRAAGDLSDAENLLGARGFAYLPLGHLSPALGGLLKLRHLLGLRSPANTVVRLLNPLGAAASIDGVFHPPYIGLHLETARLLGQGRQLVIKGAGGEAERNPAKPCNAGLWVRGCMDGEDALPNCGDHLFPAMLGRDEQALPRDISAMLEIWKDETDARGAAAIIIGTIALGLLAMGAAMDVDTAESMAPEIWRQRHR